MLEEDQRDQIKNGVEFFIDSMAAAKIDPDLWCGVCWTIILRGYKAYGWSFEDFKKQLHIMLEHYKNGCENGKG